KQYQRNRELFKLAPDEMPVFGTIASRFNDDGVTALYQALAPKLAEAGLKLKPGKLAPLAAKHSTGKNIIVPPARVRYLAEIADAVRGYHVWARAQARIARERQQLREARRMLRETGTSTTDLDPLEADRDHKLDA